MTTLMLPDEVRVRVEECERNAATWADQVMILRSKLEKAEFRLGEMTESRDEWRNRCEGCEAALAILEGAARIVYAAHGERLPIPPSKWSALEFALKETAKALAGSER